MWEAAGVVVGALISAAMTYHGMQESAKSQTNANAVNQANYAQQRSDTLGQEAKQWKWQDEQDKYKKQTDLINNIGDAYKNKEGLLTSVQSDYANSKPSYYQQQLPQIGRTGL